MRLCSSSYCLAVLFAPIAEVKLGVGGTTYADFIEFVHFPKQLAEVDPIVASFTGGAVGVVSAFFAIEIRSAQEQRKKVCMYCKGSGYLTCAECATPNTYKPGRLIDPNTGSKCVCNNCLGDDKGYVHDVFVHRYGFGNRTRSAHRSFRLIRRGRELAEMKKQRTEILCNTSHYYRINYIYHVHEGTYNLLESTILNYLPRNLRRRFSSNCFTSSSEDNGEEAFSINALLETFTNFSRFIVQG